MNASLLALAFANFVIGTGTLIMLGMLPQLADGLGVSLSMAGQGLSVPLLAGAIGLSLFVSLRGARVTAASA